MKLWFQTVFAALLFCVWSTPPQAYASRNIAGVSDTLKNAGQFLKVRFSSTAKNPVVVSLTDDSGKLVSQLATNPASKEALQSTLPSQLARNLKDNAKFSFGKMALQKLYRFPAESMGFFLSLGAIIYLDMWTKASFNPVGFNQLLDSQLDPVGQFAFYSFMVANGAATEPFQMMIRNGKLNRALSPFITYSGMAVGMLASNIVSEIAQTPFKNIAKCASTLWNNKTENYQACDQAASFYTQRGGLTGIGHQWAGSILGLVGATILASAIQYGAIKAALVISPITRMVTGVALAAGQWTLGQMVGVASLEIGAFLVPGGVVVKTIRAVTPALTWFGQMTLFNWIQFSVERVLSYRYHNWMQSDDLAEMDQTLIQNISTAKYQGWNEKSSGDLVETVKDFSIEMKRWRELNMMEALEGHANWEQKIVQLSLMYKTTELFYQDFLDRIWQRNYGKYKELYANGKSVSILDRKFPLHGILVPKAETEDDSSWLNAPDLIEERQMLTIQKAMQELQVPQLSKEDHGILNSLLEGLKQTDLFKVGQTLDLLNCYVRAPSSVRCDLNKVSLDLRKTLLNLRKSLGNPRPLWKAGAGYLVAYRTTPANLADIVKTRFDRNIRGLVTATTLPESMIASMYMGPDIEKGELAVMNDNGYQALFRAPAIRLGQPLQIQPKIPGANVEPNDIFNTGIYATLNKGQIRGSVLNANDKDAFSNWWKKHAEPQYKMAWLDFEKKYQHNIANLIESLHGGNNTAFNRGPVSNGVLHAYFQELRLLTMILGELQKDFFIQKFGTIPGAAMSTSQVLLNTSQSNQQQKGSKEPELLSYLRLNTILDFSAYMNVQNLPVKLNLDQANRKNLQWQDDVQVKFEELRSLIKNLRVQNIQVNNLNLESMPVSTLDPFDFKQKADALKEYLKQLKASAFSEGMQMNPKQAELVEVCFQIIERNLSELENYVQAANAASYVPRHDERGFSKPYCVERPQTGKSANSVRQAVQSAIEGC